MKESNEKKSQVIIDTEKCIGCGLCKKENLFVFYIETACVKMVYFAQAVFHVP